MDFYQALLIHCSLPQGDPNVPFGQVTFKVDLSRPIINEDQPEDDPMEPGQQPFQLDPAYEARFTDFPTTCRAR